MRGVTDKANRSPEEVKEFQLTRLMRGVTLPKNSTCSKAKFQLTRLMRGVTLCMECQYYMFEFQLTRLMRGVTLQLMIYQVNKPISTHTPHARRDSLTNDEGYQETISTHTPHARRDILK